HPPTPRPPARPPPPPPPKSAGCALPERGTQGVVLFCCFVLSCVLCLNKNVVKNVVDFAQM
ncbi:MAG: hypothetical protein LBD80_04585, partial [Tannerella sp.]|nr:hypothetical protein [Tannerella sp.]